MQFMTIVTCVLTLSCLSLLSACFRSNHSHTSNQISTPSEFPSFLWASRTIQVCFVNPEVASSYLVPIKNTVVREYARIGFDLSKGWSTCTAQELDELPNSPLIRIRFSTDAPAPFGGSTAVGAIYGKLSDITLRADPKTHINPFCHKEPETCLKNWALHEVGHSFGLEHNHQHPLAKVGEEYPYQLPISISRTDHAFQSVNYLGTYDPLSIMSYSTAQNYTELLPVDIRTLEALYRYPTVLLQGQSAEENGRYVSQLQLNISSLRYPDAIDYEVEKPNFYRYKVVPRDESCDLDTGYSPPIPIAKPIDEDLLAVFPKGTQVKICVVGVGPKFTQPFTSHTNLFWVIGKDPSKNYDYQGLIHLDQCSGALIRFEGSEPKDPALALTNGHCIGLSPGQVLRNQATELYVYPLDSKGKSRYFQGDDALQVKEILYATLGVTDIAILKLNATYQDLAKLKFFTLAKEGANKGSSIDVLSSLYAEGFSCQVDHIAERLQEGEASFLYPMRYSQECKLFPGTSGSPLIDKRSGKIVGINATGNDGGERCTKQNPCEIESDGKTTFQRGFGYALQTALIYDCLNTKGEIDTNLSLCRLPEK